MMRLMFFHGPGDWITRTIRLITAGPYSHVELVFSNGYRFFSSGKGLYQGVHLRCDSPAYEGCWRVVYLPASPEQEQRIQAYAHTFTGAPFDWHGVLYFLLPFCDRRNGGAIPLPAERRSGDRRRPGAYCSSVVLEVLQRALGMFPDAQLKISPNGFYRLILRQNPVIYLPVPERCNT